MKETAAQILIEKYNRGLATPEEIALLKYWILKKATEPGIPEMDYQQISEELWPVIAAETKKVKPKKVWPRIVLAASIVLCLTIGGYFFVVGDKIKDNGQIAMQEIKPGRIAATLTLANGKKVILSDANNGELAKEAGVVVTKTTDGQLVYKIIDHEGEAPGVDKMNLLSTAKGEQYEVVLPDGSKIYLNAASSLKYPVSFKYKPQRMVELTGEAYFEIFKDKRHPFIVSAGKQVIEVLGTHFNVNAYTDEPDIKTTLLEGSVKVNGSTVLKPNEQSIVNATGIRVVPVNGENFTDWKDGLFYFENESLASVMRKIARWYNVDVTYQGKADNHKTYSGVVSRSDHISKVLDMLAESEGIRFRIEGNNLMVIN